MLDRLLFSGQVRVLTRRINFSGAVYFQNLPRIPQNRRPAHPDVVGRFGRAPAFQPSHRRSANTARGQKFEPVHVGCHGNQQFLIDFCLKHRTKTIRNYSILRVIFSILRVIFSILRVIFSILRVIFSILRVISEQHTVGAQQIYAFDFERWHSPESRPRINFSHALNFLNLHRVSQTDG